MAASSAAASTSTSVSPPPLDYDAVAHKKGTDLGLDEATVLAEDNADEYLYIVQLMDENNKFEGSVMEVKSSALNRDRLTFSKAILKRYIKECVQREGGVSSPWRVKAELAKLHNINTTEGSDVQDKTRMIKAAKLAKKKPKVSHSSSSLIVRFD
jgi:bromodomain adjacent to zinc finger domain protein 1A